MHHLQFCYGFIADLTKSNKHNLYLNLLSSSLLTLASHATFSTCHNLCTYLTPPLFFQSLLGLSLRFCPHPLKTTTTKHFIEVKEWFQCDVFTQMYFAHMMSTFQSHQLFHCTNCETPDEDIPSSLHSQIANVLTTQQLHYSKGHCSPSNLTPPQRAILNTLLNNHCCIVFPVDKNLGLCILECDEYI